MAAGAIFTAGTASAHAAPVDNHSQVDTAQRPDDRNTELSTAPQVLQIPTVPNLGKYADQLRRASEREAERVAREAADRQREAERAAHEAAAEAERVAREAAISRPTAVAPTIGTFTSGFGARWGTNHNGVDIANSIGTPVRSVTDGTVIEAGPASGFGLWVRVLQDDGTIGVFGHVNEILASVGQHVRAGEVIATMGNRGQSTGPHLHYEVWQPGGVKVDPMPWLNARGIDLDHLAVRG